MTSRQEVKEKLDSTVEKIAIEEVWTAAARLFGPMGRPKG
jgi:hypothetical protein